MRFRRVFHYPPYTRMVQLLVRGRDRGKAEARADRGVATRCTRTRSRREVRISGPAPAPLERLRGQWRFQLLLRSASASPAAPPGRRVPCPRDRARRPRDRRRSARPALTARGLEQIEPSLRVCVACRHQVRTLPSRSRSRRCGGASKSSRASPRAAPRAASSKGCARSCARRRPTSSSARRLAEHPGRAPPRSALHARLRRAA